MSVTADASDTDQQSQRTSAFTGRHGRLTAAIFSTVFLIAFEAMAVATAMPSAVRALDGLAFYAWAFSGFFAASMFGMVVSGEWTDRVGPRKPLAVGAASFTAGLLIAGVAPGMGPFVAGRAVQGFGGGFVIVALYVVVARAYPENLRPKVFAAMSAAWVLPSIVGPLVAGTVADRLTWRLVFLGLLPLVIPPLVAILRVTRDIDGPQTDSSARRRGIKGLALAAAVGVALLQLAGQHLNLGGLLVGAAGLTLAVLSVPRLLPRGTLRFARGLPTVIGMRGVLAGAFFGAEAFIPLMLVEERGLSSTLAGLSLTGAALGWSAGSWFQGRTGLQIPRSRLVPVGSGIVAASIGVLALALLPSVPAAVAAVAWTIAGSGMGMAMSSLSVLVLELSQPGEQGSNSAALQVSDALFSITFVGLGGVLFAAGHLPQGSNAEVFALIFAVMAVLAAFGAAVGGRVRAPVAQG